jgi:hypothetical protein
MENKNTVSRTTKIAVALIFAPVTRKNTPVITHRNTSIYPALVKSIESFMARFSLRGGPGL